MSFQPGEAGGDFREETVERLPPLRLQIDLVSIAKATQRKPSYLPLQGRDQLVGLQYLSRPCAA